MSDPASVFVEAPARLHFGVLDLRGTLGRCFGGLGAAIPSPSLLLEGEPAGRVSAEGPDAERAAEFAERFLRDRQLSGGVRLRVHRDIPSHSGLGSGTQLGLAVARVLAELHGLSLDPVELARSTGRGKRSAIGTWAFGGGGFIVEGGRRPGGDRIAPLIARLPVPPHWRYVVAVPAAGRGLSGDDEARAFEQLPAPPEGDAERVAHLVLMQLLPSLVDDDLASFGEALSAIQRITGGWFATQQGGVFAPGPTEELIAAMVRCGAVGVGQSSWGPAAYAFAASDAAAARLARELGPLLGGGGQIFQGGFAARGARVWTGPAAPRTD